MPITNPNKWREHLASFQVHTKDGREKFVLKICEAWAQLRPAKFAFFKAGLRNLAQVAKHDDGHYDTKHGRVYVRFRVPTELVCYIQRWIPEFGADSDDIQLLKKVLGDFGRVGRDHRRRSRFYNSASNGIHKEHRTRPT